MVDGKLISYPGGVKNIQCISGDLPLRLLYCNSLIFKDNDNLQIVSQQQSLKKCINGNITSFDGNTILAQPVFPTPPPTQSAQCCYSSFSGVCDTFPFNKSYTDSSKGLCSNMPHKTCTGFNDCNSDVM